MFGLTRQEKTVVLFLTTMALVGIGANCLFKSSLHLKELPQSEFQQQKININNATEKELVSLRGIGPKAAQKIIEYRDSERDFVDLEDLKKVKGMRNQTLEKIKDYVVFE